MYATLHSIYFLFYLINFVCVDFYYRLILIKKIVKYNQVYDPCYDIKYLDLHWFLKCFELYFYLLFMIVL
jgi:hypothetical protein